MRKTLRMNGSLVWITLMVIFGIYLLFVALGNHAKYKTRLSGNKVRVAQSESRVAQSKIQLLKVDFEKANFPKHNEELENSTKQISGPITSNTKVSDMSLVKLPAADVLPRTSPPNSTKKDIAPKLTFNPKLDSGEKNIKLVDTLTDEVEFKNAVIELLSQPIINMHNFEYLRNPVDACSASKTEVLIVVPSAPKNSEKRIQIRKGTLGDYVRAISNNAKMVFFVGEPDCNENAAKLQRTIDDEFQKFGDIVQEQYLDVYKNIRLKAVSMLRWAVTYCKRAKYVIRTDDDVSVNITKIVSVVQKKGLEFPNFILGDRKDGWKPVRKNNTAGLKYQVSEEEYPNSTYPPFAVGGLLGYPLSTVSLLYQAALRVKPVWLDDVFITAICAMRLKLPLIKDPEFVFQHHS